MSKNLLSTINILKKNNDKKVIFCRIYGYDFEQAYAETLSERFLVLYQCDDDSVDIKNAYKTSMDEIESLNIKIDAYFFNNPLESFILKVRGKYVIDIPRYIEDIDIFAETFFDDGEYFWITSDGIFAGDLLRVNKNNKSIDWIPSPLEKKVKNRRYSLLKKIDDLILMFPDFANEIDIYDITTESWSRLPLDEQLDIRWFSDAIDYGDEIYLIPRWTKHIYKINKEGLELEKCHGSLEEMVNLKRDAKGDFCHKGRVYDEVFYFYSRAYNSILKMDLNTTRVSAEKIIEGEIASTCEFMENGDVLLFFQGNRHEFEKYNLLEKKSKFYQCPKWSSRVPFHCSCFDKQYLYLLPGLENTSYRLNLDTMIIEPEPRLCSEKWSVVGEQWKYVFAQNINDEIWTFDGADREFRVVKQNGVLEQFNLVMNKSDWYRGFARKILNIQDAKALDSNQDLFEYEM